MEGEKGSRRKAKSSLKYDTVQLQKFIKILNQDFSIWKFTQKFELYQPYQFFEGFLASDRDSFVLWDLSSKQLPVSIQGSIQQVDIVFERRLFLGREILSSGIIRP